MVGFVTGKRETRELRGGLVMDEDEARFFFQQLLVAVSFCHSHQVAHRWAGAEGAAKIGALLCHDRLKWVWCGGGMHVVCLAGNA